MLHDRHVADRLRPFGSQLRHHICELGHRVRSVEADRHLGRQVMAELLSEFAEQVINRSAIRLEQSDQVGEGKPGRNAVLISDRGNDRIPECLLVGEGQWRFGGTGACQPLEAGES